MMDVGDSDKRLALDRFSKLIFEKLDPLLSGDLCHDF
jgi:hypothetical protein